MIQRGKRSENDSGNSGATTSKFIALEQKYSSLKEGREKSLAKDKVVEIEKKLAVTLHPDLRAYLMQYNKADYGNTQMYIERTVNGTNIVKINLDYRAKGLDPQMIIISSDGSDYFTLFDNVTGEIYEREIYALKSSKEFKKIHNTIYDFLDKSLKEEEKLWKND